MSLTPGRRNVVAIGASAGGIEALRGLFAHLPADLESALLVVLHVPPHSSSRLHHVLAKSGKLSVHQASEGDRLTSGVAFVAPADRHLLLREDTLRLTRGPKECRARPAVDALFRSSAEAQGARVVGVLLSGMLDDGTAGLWAIKDRGGAALVQRPDEAMYPSMPSSAIEHVQVDMIGGVAEIANEIARLSSQQVQPGNPPLERHVIENRIALEGKGLEAGVMKLGPVSRFTCPDCHGVLVQINEGSLVRFRCHTGHAFSLKTLIAEVNHAIDSGLWTSLRALEERLMLLRQIADLADESGASDEAVRCRELASDSEAKLDPLRAMVLSPSMPITD